MRHGTSHISFDRDGVLLAVCGSNGLLRIFDFDECTAAMRADGKRERREDGQLQGQEQGRGVGQEQEELRRLGPGDDGYWEADNHGEGVGNEHWRQM